MMEVKDVKDIIKKIKQVGNDYEVTHSLEDDLYKAVLESIAKDPTNAQALAKEALKTQKIISERWYA